MIAASARIAKRTNPAARASGGSHSHMPSQDTARKRPMTAASLAKTGHSRSQKMVQRARRKALPSCDRAAVSGLRCAAAGWLDEVSVNTLSAEKLP